MRVDEISVVELDGWCAKNLQVLFLHVATTTGLSNESLGAAQRASPQFHCCFASVVTD